MLNPIIAKQKKSHKKIQDLELKAAKMQQLIDEQVPQLRKEQTNTTTDFAARMERLHAEVVQCALKTSTELQHQEHLAAEQSMRAVSDETRGKTAAHDMMLQAMENRVEQMERQIRTT
eukprot:4529689-Prymnesium_polylepis.1